jgi:hypothetical protein
MLGIHFTSSYKKNVLHQQMQDLYYIPVSQKLWGSFTALPGRGGASPQRNNQPTKTSRSLHLFNLLSYMSKKEKGKRRSQKNRYPPLFSYIIRKNPN